MRSMLATLLVVSACAPKMNVPIEKIATLSRLDDVMHVQATYADPQFAKIKATSFNDTEWSELDDLSQRLRATALKSKEFSKGPGYDTLADELGAHASALGDAAARKDTGAATAALAALKRTCKSCHAQYR